jgi:hypothetical protein
LLQHGFAQPLGVALPGFRMLDDLARNYIIGNVPAKKKGGAISVPIHMQDP